MQMSAATWWGLSSTSPAWLGDKNRPISSGDTHLGRLLKTTSSFKVRVDRASLVLSMLPRTSLGAVAHYTMPSLVLAYVVLWGQGPGQFGNNYGRQNADASGPSGRPAPRTHRAQYSSWCFPLIRIFASLDPNLSQGCQFRLSGGNMISSCKLQSRNTTRLQLTIGNQISR